jgi:hypothetical protein|nr:MAG TPA: hypothetical protein [Myoviridae sp. ctfuG5]
MSSNDTIPSKHFSEFNLDHEKLLSLFYREYPSAKEHDILFAYLSNSNLPSILVFDYAEDMIDEYHPINYQWIASHTQAGLAAIKHTTSVFQGSILTPAMVRLGYDNTFRYKLTLLPSHEEEVNHSIYFWDNPNEHLPIKLLNPSIHRSAVFVKDQLDLYLHLFKHYGFTILGSHNGDNITLMNTGGQIEINYHRWDATQAESTFDKIHRSKQSTSFKIDDRDLVQARQAIEQSIKIIIKILRTTDIYQIKYHLQRHHDFLSWLKSNPFSFTLKE